MRVLASKIEVLVESGDLEPTIIVAPYDGFGWSMWSDSSSGHERIEAQIMEELVPAIRARYNVATARESVSLQGFSMGGFGAVKIGLKFPAVFGRVVSWDGALHSWQTLRENRPHIVENMFESEADFDTQSPWVAAARHAARRGDDTPLHFFTGTMEAPRTMTGAFLAHLDALDLAYRYEQTPCDHDVFCLFTVDRVREIYGPDRRE